MNKPGMDDTFSRELIYLRAVGKYRWAPAAALEEISGRNPFVLSWISLPDTPRTPKNATATCPLS